MKKSFWILSLILAIGLPPLVFNGTAWWTVAKARISPLLSLPWSQDAQSSTAPTTTTAGTNLATPTGSSNGTEPSVGAAAAGTSRNQTPPLDFADVLRFDVTPAWIMQRWQWVAAGLSQLSLQGYRVPLVTGTAEDDLAGSLTYYFNSNQAVAQLTFQGTTGDANRLIRLLIQRYGFGRRLTNDPGLFRYEVPAVKGPAESYLDLRLVLPNDAYRRFEVNLVIQRPQD